MILFLHIIARLRDTPYRFVQPLSPFDVELAYGNTHERWRRSDCFHGRAPRFTIRVVGTTYCFVETLAHQITPHTPPHTRD